MGTTSGEASSSYNPQRARALQRELAETIKARMLELAAASLSSSSSAPSKNQGSPFKLVVQVQTMENRGQGGSAFQVAHWGAGDGCWQETYSSVSCVKLPFLPL